MNLRWLSVFLTWAGTLALIGGLFALAYWVHAEMQEERAREASGDKVQSPRRAKDGVVGLGTGIAGSYGIKEETAQAVSWSERVPVYGRVVPNSRATVEVRSPFAGTLKKADRDAAWPAPGQWVRSGQLLGRVDIRVSPEVRLDLRNKLDAARLQVQGAEEQVKVQQDRVNSLKGVTSQEIIARGELDAALVQLATFKTQLATAKATAELYQKALEEVRKRENRKSSTWSQSLTAPADGEVTELTGRPDMEIEAGGSIAQLVDYRRPLVRLDIPPDAVKSGPPPHVELFAVPANPPASRSALSLAEVSEPSQAVMATLAGPAPRLESASQFVSYWYDVNPVSSSKPKETRPGAINPGDLRAVWRPGLQVKAYAKPSSAKPLEAVSVPASAVLYHQGQALVYVRIEPGKYERREVRLLGREGDRWVLTPFQTLAPRGVRPGELVVVHQAQILLSEESRIDVAKD